MPGEFHVWTATFAWPTAEIAVMGPAGAANIIFKNDPDVKAKTEEYIDNFATPYQAAMRGMVDIVIEPKNTRPTIINALQMLQSAMQLLGLRPNLGNTLPGRNHRMLYGLLQ